MAKNEIFGRCLCPVVVKVFNLRMQESFQLVISKQTELFVLVVKLFAFHLYKSIKPIVLLGCNSNQLGCCVRLTRSPV